ncbi:FliA/WhiG family RNA polymerase sigma factor [Aestuariibacter sp. A3R04]|uniref:FliA/WhiG family RNA polymerase sigma factor n=1 Tax=Aestuariibacter sp. A3R04 TaxID=2841571 RepID=UPI001C0A30A4|nr:FliA/WhiG family RNA polymerase sigma factor [Aestuariibacter sp. A3R04]MBU3023128.1 FliA/WhiG family RNA polymerase sigma factor [Aestuariibacter sp. A3R04]
MLAKEQWTDIEEQRDLMSAANESEVLEKYAYLVKRAVAHMRTQIGVVVDRDDIQQIGLMALLTAIRRYGRNADAQFESYAFKCIRGAMLDEFRRTDWRPRQLRQQAHQFRDKVRQLRKELKREPSDNEICELLQLTPKQYTELQYVAQAEAIESFEQTLEMAGNQFAVGGSNEGSELDTKMSLKRAMESLPARNKLLLHLYYTHELNMKEIALTLNLTESRVCQLHKQSIEILTKKLQS